MRKIRSRKDPKIVDLLIAFGTAGYGTYVMLSEYLGERKSLRSRDDVKRIAYELHADYEMVRSILEDFDLFQLVDDQYENEDFKVKKAKEAEEVQPVQEIPEPELKEVPDMQRVNNPVPRSKTGRKVKVGIMLKKGKSRTRSVEHQAHARTACGQSGNIGNGRGGEEESRQGSGVNIKVNPTGGFRGNGQNSV